MSANLPGHFDLEVSGVCIGPDVRCRFLSAVECVSRVRVPIIWVVRRPWYNPFQGDSRGILILSDSISKEWEKTVNSSMVCRSQILGEP